MAGCQLAACPVMSEGVTVDFVALSLMRFGRMIRKCRRTCFNRRPRTCEKY